MKLDRLFSILNIRRPHGTEAIIADAFLSKYKPREWYASKGNVMAYTVNVGTSETLFSCHLDTVHQTLGNRKVRYDAKTGVIHSPDDTPLGADDGAGMWLLMEMIDAGVPGGYIFHVGEEKGGVGSKWMAVHGAKWLSTFKRAVAFDRRGSYDVITHQWSGRCCSDKFALALADELNSVLPDDYGFMTPCSGGIYTDTAEYTGVIPECTNVSCGYDHEHSSKETLDTKFLIALREACINAQWETLPVERSVDDFDDEYETWRGGAVDWGSTVKSSIAHAGSGYGIDADELYTMSHKELMSFVRNSTTEELADLLDTLAIEVMDLREFGYRLDKDEEDDGGETARQHRA